MHIELLFNTLFIIVTFRECLFKSLLREIFVKSGRNMSTKKSLVWRYFQEDDGKYAMCKICQTKLSRGGEGKNAGTSSMKAHLKSKHPDKFFENFGTGHLFPTIASVSSVTSASTSSSSVQHLSKQSSSFEVVEKMQKWSIKDTRSKEYHYLIGEMIALDNEPLSLVDRVGFTRLMQKAVPQYNLPSRSFMADKIIPDIYERITKKICDEVWKASAISVTLDILTGEKVEEIVIRFTAHWLSPDLKLKHAVLEIKPLLGCHTGVNIDKELSVIAARWNVPLNKIHIILHDSGANMMGVRVMEYDSADCFIHLIQRVVIESLETQAVLMETLAAARRIVTHLNQSELAQEKIRTIQNLLRLPEHQLVQDISTRWNSTYYLQERLLEQKHAISLYIEDHNELNNLTEQQWELMEQCIYLLKPFEEITKVISSGLSCISEVIPHVATLSRYLQKEETACNVPCLLDCLASLKTKIESCLADLGENQNYVLATLLDPRFKTSFFGTIQAENARQLIQLEALKMSYSNEELNGSEWSPPHKKKAGNASTTHNSFWDCFNEVARDNEHNNQNEDTTKCDVANELDFYLKSTRISRESDPYAWWLANAKQYPMLIRLGKIYLSSPCSCIYNERLFSAAGLDYENERNHLLAHNNEKHVFINQNLPLVNFEY